LLRAQRKYRKHQPDSDCEYAMRHGLISMVAGLLWNQTQAYRAGGVSRAADRLRRNATDNVRPPPAEFPGPRRQRRRPRLFRLLPIAIWKQPALDPPA
jgi:hypothetical protein